MTAFPTVPASFFSTTAKAELYQHLLNTGICSALATIATDRYSDIEEYIEALYQYRRRHAVMSPVDNARFPADIACI